MITLINHQGLKLFTGLQVQTPAPPLGLAYLGAYIAQHGYEYTAIDGCGEALDQILPFDEESKIMIQGLTTEQVIDRIPPDSSIIGLSCNFSHCWPLVETIAREVRSTFPDAIIVAGGEHPSSMTEEVVATGLFDVVVIGEGEITFLELIQKITAKEPWQGIDGIAYQNTDGDFVRNNPRHRWQSVDHFPFPDWERWSIKKYIAQQQVSGIYTGKSIPILGSRGCPYRCRFCSSERMWTRRYIMRDPKSIVDEMELMMKRYSVSGFIFMDSTFIINREKTISFCNEIIARKLEINYQLPAGTRCEAFDKNLVTALEKSGLKNLAFAPESGSSQIREVVHKQITLEKLFESIRLVKKTKMTIACFLVIGFPEETSKSMKETLSLARKLAVIGIDDLVVSKFTPYPGSEYFDSLVSKGLIKKQQGDLSNIISFYSSEGKSYCPAFTSKGLHSWMLWIFLNFYITSFLLRPWQVAYNFWIYFAKGRENARYMRFFTEIFFLRGRWKKGDSKNH